jgi:hypothetical protein
MNQIKKQNDPRPLITTAKAFLNQIKKEIEDKKKETKFLNNKNK